MPCIEGRQADAGVCAFLGSLDHCINAKTELEGLEDRFRVTTQSDTGETTHATGKCKATPNSTAVYTPDMRGDINITAGKSEATTKNSIAYVADTLGNINITVAVDPADDPNNAAVSSSSTPDNTNNAAGLSSSTAMDTSANDQDSCGQMSKAKKKRVGRKRAKVQAKEAAANTGDFVGSDDDDDMEARHLWVNYESLAMVYHTFRLFEASSCQVQKSCEDRGGNLVLTARRARSI